MKLILNATICVIVFFLVSCETNKLSNALEGVWVDSNSTSFSDCYILFCVNNDSVYISHFFKYNDKPYFEKGKGMIKNDTIIYHVDVVHQIPNWSSKSGTHTLTLDADKQTLRGTYKDNLGGVGPLVFKKIK